MIAQLTHLRPRSDCFERVVALLKQWGLSSSSKENDEQTPLSFVSRDGDHLFVVSLHRSEEEYRKLVANNRSWTEQLMPFLIEQHGPTFYGEVLGLEVSGLEQRGEALPAGIYIGDRI